MAPKRKAASNDEGDGNQKKAKREQTFIQKYTETWPFIKRGKLDTYVACEICSTKFSFHQVGRKRRYQAPSEKHKKNTAIQSRGRENQQQDQNFYMICCWYESMRRPSVGIQLVFGLV
ncbi:hypothetical protein BaRGS_00032919 [Batillaria attramentaria]|uniref:BED-type domain-containing protein n=1 Tax=Batillaria attramentaria TaxID=370345 RepID=A0ABD0JM00_9CAEN